MCLSPPFAIVNKLPKSARLKLAPASALSLDSVIAHHTSLVVEQDDQLDWCQASALDNAIMLMKVHLFKPWTCAVVLGYDNGEAGYVAGWHACM